MKTTIMGSLVIFSSMVNAAELKTSELKLEETIELNQLEVSGLAWRNFGDPEKQELITVGDRKFEIGILNWKNRSKANAFQKKNEFKENAGLKKHSQWEAVATDSSQQIYALQESGKFFVLSPDASQVKTVFKLSIPQKLKKELDWNNKNNSGAEGLVLLNNGHLLLLKEKSPIQIIEFAPSEDSKPEGFNPKLALSSNDHFKIPEKDPELVAIQRWALDPSQDKILTDASDLTLDKTGQLLILSDESTLIARIGSFTSTQSTFQLNRIWKLPAKIKRDAEGLVIDEKNRPVIAIDKRSVRENCFILSPLMD